MEMCRGGGVVGRIGILVSDPGAGMVIVVALAIYRTMASIAAKKWDGTRGTGA
jgi:hypothetical protein